MRNKFVRVKLSDNELLREAFIRHFQLQMILKSNTEEFYSIIDFRKAIKYNINNINLLFHKHFVLKRQFWEEKKLLSDLELIMEGVRNVIEYELLSDEKNAYFSQSDLEQSIQIFRYLERLNKKKGTN